MFKRLCCALFACLLVLPLAAQESTEYPWRAWLYNPETGEIIQVAQDGAEVNRITLPLAQAFNRYPPEIAVSPSGAARRLCRVRRLRREPQPRPARLQRADRRRSRVIRPAAQCGSPFHPRQPQRPAFRRDQPAHRLRLCPARPRLRSPHRQLGNRHHRLSARRSRRQPDLRRSRNRPRRPALDDPHHHAARQRTRRLPLDLLHCRPARIPGLHLGSDHPRVHAQLCLQRGKQRRLARHRRGPHTHQRRTLRLRALRKHRAAPQLQRHPCV